MSLLTKQQLEACKKFNQGQVVRVVVPQYGFAKGDLAKVWSVSDGRAGSSSTVPVSVTKLTKQRLPMVYPRGLGMFVPDHLEIVDECHKEWIKSKKELVADLAAVVRRFAVNFTGGDERVAAEILAKHLSLKAHGE